MAAKTAMKRSRYGVHPGVAMVQKWIRDLPAKTGRTIDQWMDYIRLEGPSDEKGCREWLKSSHGIGSNTAWWLAERARGNATGLAEENPEEYLRMAEVYVDKMYTGPKAVLRPIYDALLDLCLGLGDDVKACPCKTIVPIYRRHVFAQIKPTTRTRVDLGLALRDTKATGRLIDTGGYVKKDRITHRMAVMQLKDINADLKKWLKKAYVMDSK